jgi:Protein of unknown function (DUF2846)
MKMYILAKKSIMRKLMFLALLTMPVFLMSCAAGTVHMLEQDVKPPLAIKPDKAVLVMVRTTSFGWAVVINNYIDGKMIGQTRGKSYFITDVTPGTHYVMAHAENIAAARIQFEAGRIYFLDQGIYMGVWKARTGLSAMTAEEALKQINEKGCDCRVYNTQKPGEDLDPKDYQQTKDDFEKEVKEDPARHKDTLEYKGYSKL